MSDFEKIINKNRDAYDSDEPADGHFERFQSKLSSLHKEIDEEKIKVLQFLYKHWWKLAAAIIILIGFGFLFFDEFYNKAGTNSAQSTEIILSPELKEVGIYYSSITDERFDMINRLVSDSMEGMKIKEMVDIELSELNENYGELLQEYKNNPDDDRIINAIINNYRIRADILDNIIKKLNELKNNKNENVNL